MRVLWIVEGKKKKKETLNEENAREFGTIGNEL